MVVVNGLIWDGWNKIHIARHDVTIEEVEEVCHGDHKVVESYRKRLLLLGKTTQGKLIAVVLSPEDRNLQSYGDNLYYPITAFVKEMKP